MNIPRIEVKKGDAIDFVVDSNGTLDSDSFEWSPRIQTIARSGGGSAGGGSWSGKDDFSGPIERAEPLRPWEKYAQVLLMSNELAFVD
jgi:hypothetical protein